jgi:hypothetical protein
MLLQNRFREALPAWNREAPAPPNRRASGVYSRAQLMSSRSAEALRSAEIKIVLGDGLFPAGFFESHAAATRALETAPACADVLRESPPSERRVRPHEMDKPPST